MRKIVIATRGSRLALVQAEMVKNAVLAAGAGEVEIKTVKTRGDRDRNSPLGQIGGKGLFVKEIETVLAEGEGDIAVHSSKDLPYELLEGMVIGAVLPSADARDCLISVRGRKLPENPVIGTGSRRRVLSCSKMFPGASFKEIRGNVDTRLKKLSDGEYDAIVLAKAGLDRLGAELSDYDVKIFDTEEFIPAPCQGIIAVECRSDDGEVLSLLEKINDEPTRLRFEIERRVFAGIEADCSVAVGVHAVVSEATGDRNAQPSEAGKQDNRRIKVSAMLEEKRIDKEIAIHDMDSAIEEITRYLLEH